MPKKMSPKESSQRAREKGSDVNNAVVNGTAVKKHMKTTMGKYYTRAWGYEIGKSIALDVLKEADSGQIDTHETTLVLTRTIERPRRTL